MQNKESLLLGAQSLDDLDLTALKDALRKECKQGERFPRKISRFKTSRQIKKMAKMYQSELIQSLAKDENEEARILLKKLRRWPLWSMCILLVIALLICVFHFVFKETFKDKMFLKSLGVSLLLAYMFCAQLLMHEIKKQLWRYLCFLLLTKEHF